MPQNETYLFVTLAIVLAGLIVTTTSVDIVGAYYMEKLHFFGRRLDSDVRKLNCLTNVLKQTKQFLQDPLEWLKAVQKKRIEAMKREAMRRLFETVSALHRMKLQPSAKRVLADDEFVSTPENSGELDGGDETTAFPGRH